MRHAVALSSSPSASDWWHENCGIFDVANELKMAPWAQAELRRKRRAEQRVQWLCQVRFIFVVLLLATIAVFIFNHQVQMQSLAAARLNVLLSKPAAASEHLKSQALQYERQLDQITGGSTNNP